MGCDLFVTAFNRYPEWHDREHVIQFGCHELGLELPQWSASWAKKL
jgi:hypothetical protein